MSNISKCLCVFSAALAFVVSPTIEPLRAQTSAYYNELAPDLFLKSWKLLGPISLSGNSDTSTAVPDEEAQKKNFDTDFLAACGSETGVYSSSPPACKINNQDHSWKLVQSGDDILDLAKELGPKEYAVAYALAEVESSAAVTVIFGVGSDDAVVSQFIEQERYAPRNPGCGQAAPRTSIPFESEIRPCIYGRASPVADARPGSPGKKKGSPPRIWSEVMVGQMYFSTCSMKSRVP